jgi:hypothetical protein
MKKRWQLRRSEGQSLVELALTLPILLLMLAGLVEVGAALRNYLIVVNADREGVRFAARGRWFDSAEEIQEIFNRVVAAAGYVQQGGGELVQFLRPSAVGDLPANATIAITFIQVPDQIDETGGLVAEPPIINGPWYTPAVPPHQTRIDAVAVAEAARQENYEFNKKYFVNDGPLDIPSEDNFVIIEVWYDHEQWLKLPLFTEILPERFTMYAQSTMRVTLDSRVE